MNILLNIIIRNCKLYYRDKSTVFFSFLSVFIIIFMYAIFLADVQSSAMSHVLGQSDGAKWIVNSWIMAGIIIVNSITIPLVIQGRMIEDISDNTFSDFITAPISRSKIVLGYVISSWVIGIAVAIATIFISEIYIKLAGGEFLTFYNFIRALLVSALSVISMSSITFFFITFIRSRQALSVLSTLVGTFVGFLSGIYLPIGSITSAAVRNAITLFPASYSAALLRQIFTDQPINEVFLNSSDQQIKSFESIFGLTLNIGDFEFTNSFMIFILFMIIIVFFSLSVLRLRKYKK